MSNHQASAPKEAPELDAHVDLARRLWQFVLPIPNAAAATTTTASDESALSAAAASGSASLPESRTDTRDRDRERDAMSLLAVSAHVLASAVHQLGFLQYGQHEHAARNPHSEVHQAAFNVRFSNVANGGGVASLQIVHAQLGDIGLDVELDNGVVRVVACASSEQAAQIIEDGQAVLAEQLARQGIVLEALDVVVAQGTTRSKAQRVQRKRPRGRHGQREHSAHEQER